MTETQARTTTLFRAGEGGYAGYRIPGLLAITGGRLLAYAEARRDSQHDWGAIDVVARRSEDGGLTWSAPERWAHDGESRPKNPVAITRGLAVPDTVTAHNPVLLPGAGHNEVHLVYGLEYRHLFHRYSSDHGYTWSPAREITGAADPARLYYPWQTIAAGPGHGVRLDNGQLVATVWYSLGEGGNAHKPSRTGAIWSRDEGVTWQAGALLSEARDFISPNEASLAKLEDGRLLLNLRNVSPAQRRALSWSDDGGASWSQPTFAHDLVEPICMGGMTSAAGRLFFTHPDTLEPRAGQPVPPKPGTSRARRNLCLHTSYDSGLTWQRERVIDAGPSGYSDVAVTPDGRIHVLYERLTTDAGAHTAELRLTSWPTAS